MVQISLAIWMRFKIGAIALALILRITRGNIRLIERLMMQVEHVLVANQVTLVTKEVVEIARKNLIIGPD